VFSKQFLKNANKNMPSGHVFSHLRQDVQIHLLSSPDCPILIAVSENTHVPHILLHNGHYGVKQAIMRVFGNSYNNLAFW
jgi:hypothetical protein